jgi:hypothetical protein
MTVLGQYRKLPATTHAAPHLAGATFGEALKSAVNRHRRLNAGCVDTDLSMRNIWIAPRADLRTSSPEVGSARSRPVPADAQSGCALMTPSRHEAYYPFLRQLAIAKKMDAVESARFMALGGIAINDSLIAVLDAKYHYNFWRPITAIRNGDIDGNPATDRDSIWQPITETPMHPEYPCALSGSVAGVVKATLGTGDVREVAMTSSTAPGVTHRWTNMTAFTDEVANARIWSGFHYRFSTRVGTGMGLQIGEYVVKNMMQPVATSSR